MGETGGRGHRRAGGHMCRGVSVAARVSGLWLVLLHAGAEKQSAERGMLCRGLFASLLPAACTALARSALSLAVQVGTAQPNQPTAFRAYRAMRASRALVQHLSMHVVCFAVAGAPLTGMTGGGLTGTTGTGGEMVTPGGATTMTDHATTTGGTGTGSGTGMGGTGGTGAGQGWHKGAVRGEVAACLWLSGWGGV